MEKERYFVLTDADSADKLNEFLAKLEDREIDYETDYETEHRNGTIVIVSFED